MEQMWPQFTNVAEDEEDDVEAIDDDKTPPPEDPQVTLERRRAQARALDEHMTAYARKQTDTRLEQNEHYFPLMEPNDKRWVDKRVEFKIRLQNESVLAVMEGNFTENQKLLLLPPKENGLVLSIQTLHTKYYNAAMGPAGKFVNSPNNIVTKLTMAYFGLPVEPITYNNIMNASLDENDEKDLLEDEPLIQRIMFAEKPLEFLDKYHERSYGYPCIRRPKPKPLAKPSMTAAPFSGTPSPIGLSPIQPKGNHVGIRGGAGRPRPASSTSPQQPTTYYLYSHYGGKQPVSARLGGDFSEFKRVTLRLLGIPENSTAYKFTIRQYRNDEATKPQALKEYSRKYILDNENFASRYESTLRHRTAHITADWMLVVGLDELDDNEYLTFAPPLRVSWGNPPTKASPCLGASCQGTTCQGADDTKLIYNAHTGDVEEFNDCPIAFMTAVQKVLRLKVDTQQSFVSLAFYRRQPIHSSAALNAVFVESIRYVIDNVSQNMYNTTVKRMFTAEGKELQLAVSKSEGNLSQTWPPWTDKSTSTLSSPHGDLPPSPLSFTSSKRKAKIFSANSCTFVYRNSTFHDAVRELFPDELLSEDNDFEFIVDFFPSQPENFRTKQKPQTERFKPATWAVDYQRLIEPRLFDENWDLVVRLPHHQLSTQYPKGDVWYSMYGYEGQVMYSPDPTHIKAFLPEALNLLGLDKNDLEEFTIRIDGHSFSAVNDEGVWSDPWPQIARLAAKNYPVFVQRSSSAAPEQLEPCSTDKSVAFLTLGTRTGYWKVPADAKLNEGINQCQQAFHQALAVVSPLKERQGRSLIRMSSSHDAFTQIDGMVWQDVKEVLSEIHEAAVFEQPAWSIQLRPANFDDERKQYVSLIGLHEPQSYKVGDYKKMLEVISSFSDHYQKRQGPSHFRIWKSAKSREDSGPSTLIEFKPEKSAINRLKSLMENGLEPDTDCVFFRPEWKSFKLQSLDGSAPTTWDPKPDASLSSFRKALKALFKLKPTDPVTRYQISTPSTTNDPKFIIREDTTEEEWRKRIFDSLHSSELFVSHEYDVQYVGLHASPFGAVRSLSKIVKFACSTATKQQTTKPQPQKNTTKSKSAPSYVPNMPITPPYTPGTQRTTPIPTRVNIPRIIAPRAGPQEQIPFDVWSAEENRQNQLQHDSYRRPQSVIEPGQVPAGVNFGEPRELALTVGDAFPTTFVQRYTPTDIGYLQDQNTRLRNQALNREESCRLCTRSFPDWNSTEIADHWKEHREAFEAIGACPICDTDWVFMSASAKKSHLYRHQDTFEGVKIREFFKLLSCPICDQDLHALAPTEVLFHVGNHFPETVRYCHSCGLDYKLASNYESRHHHEICTLVEKKRSIVDKPLKFCGSCGLDRTDDTDETEHHCITHGYHCRQCGINRELFTRQQEDEHGTICKPPRFANKTFCHKCGKKLADMDGLALANHHQTCFMKPPFLDIELKMKQQTKLQAENNTKSTMLKRREKSLDEREQQLVAREQNAYANNQMDIDRQPAHSPAAQSYVCKLQIGDESCGRAVDLRAAAVHNHVVKFHGPGQPKPSYVRCGYLKSDCTECQMLISTTTTLQQHMAAEHWADITHQSTGHPFNCPLMLADGTICDSRFPLTPDALRHHYSNHAATGKLTDFSCPLPRPHGSGPCRTKVETTLAGIKNHFEHIHSRKTPAPTSIGATLGIQQYRDQWNEIQSKSNHLFEDQKAKMELNSKRKQSHSPGYTDNVRNSVKGGTPTASSKPPSPRKFSSPHKSPSKKYSTRPTKNDGMIPDWCTLSIRLWEFADPTLLGKSFDDFQSRVKGEDNLLYNDLANIRKALRAIQDIAGTEGVEPEVSGPHGQVNQGLSDWIFDYGRIQTFVSCLNGIRSHLSPQVKTDVTVTSACGLKSEELQSIHDQLAIISRIVVRPPGSPQRSGVKSRVNPGDPANPDDPDNSSDDDQDGDNNRGGGGPSRPPNDGNGPGFPRQSNNGGSNDQENGGGNGPPTPGSTNPQNRTGKTGFLPSPTRTSFASRYSPSKRAVSMAATPSRRERAAKPSPKTGKRKKAGEELIGLGTPALNQPRSKKMRVASATTVESDDGIEFLGRRTRATSGTPAPSTRRVGRSRKEVVEEEKVEEVVGEEEAVGVSPAKRGRRSPAKKR